MTWDDLFERARVYEATEDDVRAALTAVRGSGGDGIVNDGRGDGGE